MTDWLRVLAYSVLGFVILIGLVCLGWIVASRRKLHRYRLSDTERQQIRDSRVGWYADRDDPQKEDPHVH